MNRLPESDPDVEYAEARGNAAYESAGDEVSKRGIGKEQRVVRPVGTPRHDHQHDSESGAEEDEKEHSDAAKPKASEGQRRIGNECGTERECSFRGRSEIGNAGGVAGKGELGV